MAIDVNVLRLELERAQERLARYEVLDLLTEQAERRGVGNARRAVEATTATWPPMRFRVFAERRKYAGGFHKHAEIAKALGVSRAEVEKHWAAFYELTVADSGGRRVVILDARNMAFSTDGCVLRLDADDPLAERVLTRIVNTTERAAKRFGVNWATALAALVMGQQVAEAARRKARERARKIQEQIAQLQLALFGAATGTDGK
jgi:hypothetical protein